MQTDHIIAKAAFGIGQDQDGVICRLLDHFDYVVFFLNLGEHPNRTAGVISDQIKQIIIAITEVVHAKAGRHTNLLEGGQLLKLQFTNFFHFT